MSYRTIVSQETDHGSELSEDLPEIPTVADCLEAGLPKRLIAKCINLARSLECEPKTILSIALEAAGSRRRGKNPHAVALGRMGGQALSMAGKGIKALDPSRRQEIARKAAAARWRKRKEAKGETKDEGLQALPGEDLA